MDEEIMRMQVPNREAQSNYFSGGEGISGSDENRERHPEVTE
jgi:hypothetical protein